MIDLLSIMIDREVLHKSGTQDRPSLKYLDDRPVIPNTERMGFGEDRGGEKLRLSGVVNTLSSITHYHHRN